MVASKDLCMDLRALRSQVHNVACIWEGRERAGGKGRMEAGWWGGGNRMRGRGGRDREMGEGGVELKGEWCHLHTFLWSHT